MVKGSLPYGSKYQRLTNCGNIANKISTPHNFLRGEYLLWFPKNAIGPKSFETIIILLTPVDKLS
jgi:hypothetical protein